MLNIIIRTDASYNIGTGHVMRCLTLAEKLLNRGCTIEFICRELDGNLCDFIEAKGYKINSLNKSIAEGDYINPDVDAQDTVQILTGKTQETNWFIVDHYSLDIRWEAQIRPFVQNIMVIDDLADRAHDCNILLDQNLVRDMETRYNNLVPKDCHKFLGPSHLLLRPQFYRQREKLRTRDGRIKNILVFFGGSDQTNETVKALEAIDNLGIHGLTVTVIVGASNPHKDSISTTCSGNQNMLYYCQTENMAELIAKADLVIGAGGVSLWERCFLGAPSITLIVAENQVQSVLEASKKGVTWNVGWNHNLTSQELSKYIKKALDNPAGLIEMGKKGLALMENSGSFKDMLVEKIMAGGLK